MILDRLPPASKYLGVDPVQTRAMTQSRPPNRLRARYADTLPALFDPVAPVARKIEHCPIRKVFLDLPSMYRQVCLRLHLPALVIAIIGCTGVGCAWFSQSTEPEHSSEQSNALAPSERGRGSGDVRPIVSSPSTDTPEATSSQPDHSAEPPPAVPVDGMVGQVNGQAIYASSVFEELDPQLQALGRLSPREFREQARRLITQRIVQMVQDALILGEADRDLSEQERFGLKELMKKNRQELIRKKGLGSSALADATLHEETSKSLDQTLKELRDYLLVKRYIDQKVLATISVSRRDIQRYYKDHWNEFNPPSTRTFRRIRVLRSEDAHRVTQQLEEGKSFEQVASSELNLYKRTSGGLMSPIKGHAQLADDKLNEAMKALKPKLYSGPIETGGVYWFIYLDSLEQFESKPLEEVQLEIHRMIKNQRNRKSLERFQQHLLKEGNYTSFEQMASILVRIAINRYNPSSIRGSGTMNREVGINGKPITEK